MKINSVKIISLLFFVLSAFYLYTAHQIQVFAFDEGAPFNAKTFPIYLGYAGMFFSGLKIVLPDQKPVQVDPTYLEFKKTILLVLTMIVYGATILKAGFFLSTSLFLVLSYYFIFTDQKFLNTKIVIHEQNRVIGRANKLMLNFCDNL